MRSVSNEAIISGRAAFFAPEIGMVPLSFLPPTMRMRSIRPRSRRPMRLKLVHLGRLYRRYSSTGPEFPEFSSRRPRACALRRLRFSRKASASRCFSEAFGDLGEAGWFWGFSELDMAATEMFSQEFIGGALARVQCWSRRRPALFKEKTKKRR